MFLPSKIIANTDQIYREKYNRDIAEDDGAGTRSKRGPGDSIVDAQKKNARTFS